MQSVEFYSLSRVIQDRFIDATQGDGALVPLLSRPHGAKSERLLILLGMLVAIGAVALLIPGTGDLQSSIALLPPTALAGVALLEALGWAVALLGLGRERRPKRLPYTPGTYLFPAGLFDARGGTITHYPMQELESVKPTRRGIAVEFRGTSPRLFPMDPARVASMRTAILDCGKPYAAALASKRRGELARFDPFIEAEYSSPFAETKAHTRSEPLWARLWPLVAILAAAGIIAPLGYARNYLSEARMYRAARDTNTVASYTAYLDRGGQRPDVPQELLPRAEIELARSGGVSAVEQYIATHPNSALHDELRIALRSTLLVALRAAAKPGTLAGLDQFQVAHPNHDPVQPELIEARKHIMRATLDDFRKVASQWNKELLPFITELIDYSAAHGPEVHIRFRASRGDSFKYADAQVRLSAYYMGPEAVPSQYFDKAHAIAREKKLAGVIMAALNQAFRPEILHFEHGSRSDEAAETGSIEIPTLFIHHQVDLSGGFVLHKPRSVFVGAGMVFHTLFRIPGSKSQLKFKFSRWRPPETRLMVEKNSPGVPGVYEDIASDGYGSFGDKFLRSFLANP